MIYSFLLSLTLSGKQQIAYPETAMRTATLVTQKTITVKIIVIVIGVEIVIIIIII